LAAVPTIESPSSDYLKSASIFSLVSLLLTLGLGPRFSSIILPFLLFYTAVPLAPYLCETGIPMT